MASPNKDHDYMFKIVLIGLTGVGKSNILLRYTKDEFSADSQSTLGVQYATKLIVTDHGTRIKLQIWDTAGQEKYRSLMKTFYKGAAAAIVVYDITRESSFQNIEKELTSMREVTKSDFIAMLVGNKADLEQQRVVSKERAMEFAEEKRMAYYETSAKTGLNVELIFERLAQELERAMTTPNVESIEDSSKNIKGSIALSHKSTVPTKKQCCN